MMMFMRSLPEIVSNAKLSGAICDRDDVARHDGRAGIAAVREIGQEQHDRLLRMETEQPRLKRQRVQERARGVRNEKVSVGSM